MTNKFPVGTRVSVDFKKAGYRFDNREGVVQGHLKYSEESNFVVFEGRFNGHNGNGVLEGGDLKVGNRGWFLTDNALTAVIHPDRVPGFKFSTKNPPKVGDVVECRFGEHHKVTEVDLQSGIGRVIFGSPTDYWCIYPEEGISACTLVTPAAEITTPAPAPVASSTTRVKPTKRKPAMPTAPMTAAVLDLLQSKGSVTSLEANGVIKCRSLSKRISELKALGWNIKSELKRDHSDQRYARYHLVAA